ncbi:MAG: hypothetical protein WC530_02935 [Candidatus Omnitrophota bacterium]|jgi:hypothetical protein
MLQLIGILFSVNSIIITWWCLANNYGNKAGVVIGCVIALFFGCFLMLQHRAVELTFKWVGSIKAASEQASADAGEIAKLRGRIESQSATVDLVAKSADEARNLVRSLEKKNSDIESKVGKINSDVEKSDKALGSLEKANDFSSILFAAQNDDAKAFEQLVSWVDKDAPFKKIAANAIIKIRTDAGGPIKPGFLNIDWRGTDPKALSSQQIMKLVANLQPIFHTALVHEVRSRSDFSKRDKMQFYVEVLHSSNSLLAKNYAGEFFTFEANDSKLKWQPFSITPLFQWWDENKDKV